VNFSGVSDEQIVAGTTRLAGLLQAVLGR